MSEAAPIRRPPRSRAAPRAASARGRRTPSARTRAGCSTRRAQSARAATCAALDRRHERVRLPVELGDVDGAGLRRDAHRGGRRVDGGCQLLRRAGTLLRRHGSHDAAICATRRRSRAGTLYCSCDGAASNSVSNNFDGISMPVRRPLVQEDLRARPTEEAVRVRPTIEHRTNRAAALRRAKSEAKIRSRSPPRPRLPLPPVAMADNLYSIQRSKLQQRSKAGEHASPMSILDNHELHNIVVDEAERTWRKVLPLVPQLGAAARRAAGLRAERGGDAADGPRAVGAAARRLPADGRPVADADRPRRRAPERDARTARADAARGRAQPGARCELGAGGGAAAAHRSVGRRAGAVSRTRSTSTMPCA